MLLGTKDGQTKMVKDGKGKVELYSWEAATSLWKKVGDVVGSSGGSQATSGKTLYEGQVGDSCIFFIRFCWILF